MTTTSTPATTSVSISDARIDVEALEFAKQHNLLEYLNAAVQLATRHFRPIEPICVELMIDPEGDWDKLLLNVVVVGTLENVMQRYDAYLDEWINMAPSDTRFLMGLIYDIRTA